MSPGIWLRAIARQTINRNRRGKFKGLLPTPLVNPHLRRTTLAQAHRALLRRAGKPRPASNAHGAEAAHLLALIMLLHYS